MIAVCAACAVAAMAQQPGWSGSINLNANLAISTQNAQSLFIDARARQVLAQGGLFEYSALYILTRQTSGLEKVFQTTEDRYQFFGRYDTPTDGIRFGFFTQTLERNRLVELDLRSVTSAGLGFFVRRTKNVRETGRVGKNGDEEWKLNLGVSYLRENFINSPIGREDYGLQLTSNYSKILPRGIEISSLINYTPVFRKFDDYVLFSNLSLAFPLNPRTRIALNFIYDFTTNPAPGQRNDNYKYALTLGYRF